MSYNIPTSGQIRLGYDFNRCFYHNSANSTQLNMDNSLVRETSVSISQSSDTPYTSGAQKNMAAYRGSTGSRGITRTTSTTTTETDQTYQVYTEVEPTIYSNATARVVYNYDTTYNRVDYLYAQSQSGGSGGGNTAANTVVYLGYLEPGNYQFGYYCRVYNSGTAYAIIRGYTSGLLSGSYSNYVYASKSWSSGSYTDFASSGTSFTVNSTYPYVILDFECHNNNEYFLRTQVLRKGNNYGTTYNANAFVKRV